MNNQKRIEEIFNNKTYEKLQIDDIYYIITNNDLTKQTIDIIVDHIFEEPSLEITWARNFFKEFIKYGNNDQLTYYQEKFPNIENNPIIKNKYYAINLLLQPKNYLSQFFFTNSQSEESYLEAFFNPKCLHNLPNITLNTKLFDELVIKKKNYPLLEKVTKIKFPVNSNQKRIKTEQVYINLLKNKTIDISKIQWPDFLFTKENFATFQNEIKSYTPLSTLFYNYLRILDDDKNILEDIIIERLNQGEQLQLDNNLYEYITKVCYDLTVECHPRIIEKLYETNNYSILLLNTLVNYNKLPNQHSLDELIEHLNSHPPINDKYLQSKLSDAPISIDNNLKKKLIKLLLDTKQYQLAFSLVNDSESQKILLNNNQLLTYLQSIDILENFPNLNTYQLDILTSDSKIFLQFIKNPNIINEYRQKNNLSSQHLTNPKILDYLKNNPNIILGLMLGTTLTNIKQTIITNEKLLSIWINNIDVSQTAFLNWIQHETLNSLITKETYQLIRENLAKSYQYDLHRLDQILQKFGYNGIAYLEDVSLKKMSLLPQEQFDSFLNLLNPKTLTHNQFNAICSSLIQKKFADNNPDIINLFPLITNNITNPEKFQYYINILQEGLLEYYQHSKKYKPQTEQQYHQKLTKILDDIIIGLKSGKKSSFNALHKLVNTYITYQRGLFEQEYRHQTNLYELLNIPYKYNEQSLKREGPSYLAEHPHLIFDFLTNSNYLTKNQSLFKLISEQPDLFVECLTFIKYGTNEEYTHNLKNITNNLKIVRPFLQELATNPNLGVLSQINTDQIKKDYYFEDNHPNYYELISNIDFNILSANTLSKPEILTTLTNNLNKSNILNWGTIFEPLQTETDLQFTTTDIAKFIQYYYKISEQRLKEKQTINLTIPNIITEAQILGTLPGIYDGILGKEDKDLIKKNPPRNAAVKKQKNNENLNEAIKLTIELFNRTKVTIPTFRELCPTANPYKQLEVSVGNFTSPSNLTHGERTGSCMRIGGAGEGLFKFCLQNDHGFHIELRDPLTKEYISRVSGFRPIGSNTIILNELRQSCNYSKYSDEDIVEAITKTSELLIKKSQDSPNPIENIIIEKSYALEKNKTFPPLNIQNINFQQGLNKFYCDTLQNSRAILLATSTPKDQEVKFTFNNPDVMYETLRDQPIYSENLTDELKEKITRIQLVNEIIQNGGNYEYLEIPTFEHGFQYGAVGGDWYSYVDDEGKNHEVVIESNKERAQLELNTYKNMLNQENLSKQPQLELTSTSKKGR